MCSITLNLATGSNRPKQRLETEILVLRFVCMTDIVCCSWREVVKKMNKLYFSYLHVLYKYARSAHKSYHKRQKDTQRVYKHCKNKKCSRSKGYQSSTIFFLLTCLWVPLKQLFLLLVISQSIGPFHMNCGWKMNESSEAAATAKLKVGRFPEVYVCKESHIGAFIPFNHTDLYNQYIY